MNKKNPDWYQKTIARLSCYPMLYTRAAILRLRLDPDYHWGADVPGTAQEAEKELLELTYSLNEVDYVVGQLAKDKQELIKLRYFQRGAKDVEVMKQLALSQSSYYRLRNRTILNVANLFNLYLE